MKKHQNILVYQRVDCPSRCGLDFATKLAKESPGARVHLVDIQAKLTGFWDDLLDRDFDAQQSQIRSFQLRQFAEQDENVDDITCKVLSGRPLTELVEYIQSNDIDLVVKVGGGGDHSILSSLDHRMIRQCSANVVIARNDHTLIAREHPTILVAINPIEDDAETRMNIRLLHSAALLAERFGAQLRIVSAVNPPGIQWAHNDEAIDECRRIENKALSRGRVFLEQMLESSEVPVKPSNITLAFCEPEKLILRQVESMKADFLVMGSVVRGWASGLLVGSVTDRVSHALPCTLVALRPEKAISTVALQAGKALSQ